MKRSHFAFATVFLLGAFIAAAPARAQATRTWVSGVGDDANPCSRTAPCKTFAGAISKTAPAGEINALDPGGFGALTITKSITIDGGPGIAGVLVSGTHGIVVNAGQTDVVHLRNLDIDGLGTGLSGVDIVQAGSVHVENSHIYNFTQPGINFVPVNTTTPAQLAVNNTVITDNPGGGVLVAPTVLPAGAQLFNVTASRNLFGLRVQDKGSANAFESVFSANAFNGVVAASTAAASEINVKKSLISNNNNHGVFATGAGATVSLTDNGIFDNVNGLVTASGGAIVSYGNNQIGGTGTPGAPTQTIGQQ